MTESMEDARTLEAILADPTTDPDTFREMSNRLKKLKAISAV